MTIAAPAPVDFEHCNDPDELLHAREDRVRFIYVPYRRYYAIDGTAAPGSPGFQDAIGTLYPVAYTLHFLLRERDVRAPVGALEGLYWEDRPGPMPLERFASGGGRPPLAWRLLIGIPEAATDDEVHEAIDRAAERRAGAPPAMEQLMCVGWLEGESAQILHVGGYDAEYPTMERLGRALREAGLRPRGCHHELYLSGPGTAADRLKTVLRTPVEEIAW